jgi:hypothetical protein
MVDRAVSGCVARLLTKDGTVRNDKTASIHVTKPAAIYELGQAYQAQGRVWVQPYESNGRVALSITVEQLVPAKADAVPGNKSQPLGLREAGRGAFQGHLNPVSHPRLSPDRASRVPDLRWNVERMTRLELATSTLGRSRSTN